MSLSDFSINDDDATINPHEILRTVATNNRLSTSSFEDEMSSYQKMNKHNLRINVPSSVGVQGQYDSDISRLTPNLSAGTDSPIPPVSAPPTVQQTNQRRFFPDNPEERGVMTSSTSLATATATTSHKRTSSVGNDPMMTTHKDYLRSKSESNSSSPRSSCSSSSMKDVNFEELNNRSMSPISSIGLPVLDRPIMFRSSSTLPSSLRGGCDFNGFREPKTKRLSLKSAVSEIIKMGKRNSGVTEGINVL